MPLLILIYPFAEIYAFYRFIDTYSFWDAVILVMLSSLLGILILMSQGKAAVRGLQTSLSEGKIPANQILHRAIIMFGGLLLFIPGIISDVIGLLCILPISRHLIVWYMKFSLAKGISRGKVGFFVSGFGFPNDIRFRQSSPGAPFEVPAERDATVVDVTPIEITHQNKKED